MSSPRKRATGWYVEVDHSSGGTHVPAVVEEQTPSILPTEGGYPRAEIPIARAEKWTDSGFEDVAMRVWKDGARQPIDELVEPEVRPNAVILKARGGIELDQTVQAEYAAQEVHLAAQDLIQNETSYTANVDTPNTTVETNVTVQSADTSDEFSTLLANSIPDTVPLDNSNGTIDAQQCAKFFEGENPTRNTTTESDELFEDYSDGEALTLDSTTDVTDSPEYDWTPNYDIPSGNVEVHYRLDVEADNENPEFTISINGEEVELISADILNAGLGWRSTSTYSSSVSSGSTITAKFEVDAQGTSPVYVDAVHIRDNRFSYTNDNTVDAINGYLDGPEERPSSDTDLTELVFQDSQQTLSVTGGRVETTSDRGAISKLELSNDFGASFPLSATDTDAFEADFADRGAALRLKLTLGRWGSRDDQSPKTGYKGESLDSYTLKADLEDMPLVVDRSFDGKLKDILNDLANLGNFVWEFRRDGSTESIEWTQLDQRSATADIDLNKYREARQTEPVVEQVTIKGASRRVTAESVTANHGTAVELAENDIVEGSEEVRDTSSGTVYTRNQDYKFTTSSTNGYLEGKITTLSNGAIADGQSLEIDYEYRVSNTRTKNGVTNPDERTETIPSLATSRACGLVAEQLVQNLSTPQYRVQVTIPPDEVDFSVVDDLTIEQLPFDTSHQVLDVSKESGQVLVTLGTRQSAGDIIQDAVERIQSISRYN